MHTFGRKISSEIFAYSFYADPDNDDWSKNTHYGWSVEMKTRIKGEYLIYTGVGTDEASCQVAISSATAIGISTTGYIDYNGNFKVFSDIWIY